MPLCLCTPPSPFLSHLSPTSFSQFLISFQNSHRHRPAHSPPNPTFLYLCPSCRLGDGPPLDSQSSVLKAASCSCLHYLVITCLPAFMAPDCELDCEARVGLDLSSLSAVLAQHLAQNRCWVNQCEGGGGGRDERKQARREKEGEEGGEGLLGVFLVERKEEKGC